jgi:signal transduction histidine kinase
VQEAGLSVQLEVTGAPSGLPARVGHAGYRIVQEGLTNVLRHSTARQAHVRVEAGDRVMVIEVADDGQLQAPAALAGGHGLAGMRERAAALGGTVVAGPHHDGGFQVHLELPIRQGEFAL